VDGEAAHSASPSHLDDATPHTNDDHDRRIIMGTNLPKKNRTDQTVADQRLIDGLTKHAAAITSLLIGGSTLSTTDIIAVLQTRIGASDNATTTRATWRAAVVTDIDEHAKTRTFLSGLRQALLVAFAGQVDTLADFGLTARKVRVLTPDQVMAAVAKAKATRAARHTMGKVQKSKITGANPTGAAVVPAPGPTKVKQ
jgi:hypothetical protein